jgi:hypothetical protein
MGLPESRRHTLAFWSLGLVLFALTGSIVAWMSGDGYPIDWPWIGLMVATLASTAAILIKPTRPRLHTVLNGVAIALTFPFATWVLWRVFTLVPAR